MPVATIKRIIRILIRTSATTTDMESEPETAALTGEIRAYAGWISAHIPYFNRLSVTEKERFIRRVYYFRQRKQFHFHGVEPLPEIPVLVSAAAVQLTFGLRRYQLPYFRHIHILADAYPLQDHQGLFIGHVDRQQICLSWKHFLEGYADATDNVNVAIHEMAHAVQFENFIPQKGVDWEFRADFERFMQATGPAFLLAGMGRPSYLRQYAYTNAREFWAVSVEAFFENPAALNTHMPGLYQLLRDVLNQDPLTGQILPPHDAVRR
ncbi:MAG: zinc-dependent peptidase [Chitinophagaceae bacterium]